MELDLHGPHAGPSDDCGCQPLTATSSLHQLEELMQRLQLMFESQAQSKEGSLGASSSAGAVLAADGDEVPNKVK